MNKLKEIFAGKSVAHFVFYAVLCLGLVADIVFIAVDFGDFTFHIGCFVCVLLGSIVGLVDIVFPYGNICLWASSLLYVVAFGFHMSVALASLSDLWNGINFIGGNQTVATAFLVIFGVLTLALIALNFFDFKKKNAEKTR